MTAFNLFSSDGSSVTYRDLKRVAREVGDPMTDADIFMIMDEFDESGDGEISMEEWIQIMGKNERK